MIDVAVVGAGLAGLLTAARCAESGLDVLLLEEHARIGRPTHCTGIVSLEPAELSPEGNRRAPVPLAVPLIGSAVPRGVFLLRH